MIGSKPNGLLRRMVSAVSSVLAQFGGVMLAFAFIATLGINGVGTMLIKTLFDYTLNPNWLSSLPGLVTVYCYFQIPLMIQGAMRNEMDPNQQGFAQVLAFAMIVVVAIVMMISHAVEKRAGRWQ